MWAHARHRPQTEEGLGIGPRMEDTNFLVFSYSFRIVSVDRFIRCSYVLNLFRFFWDQTTAVRKKNVELIQRLQADKVKHQADKVKQTYDLCTFSFYESTTKSD